MTTGSLICPRSLKFKNYYVWKMFVNCHDERLDIKIHVYFGYNFRFLISLEFCSSNNYDKEAARSDLLSWIVTVFWFFDFVKFFFDLINIWLLAKFWDFVNIFRKFSDSLIYLRNITNLRKFLEIESLLFEIVTLM